ncbi:winged helix-turn-helix domain-containing protein [Vibrio vulnificus]|nr:transcriptional regulator [Vibrio vulnificus]EHU5003511.1 winged helix-turn-helix domain-containing protein [Vibrio vulnificus]EHZ7121297.1 winged helix-turn-helix domain-containing protein [Vibrio vulnificus]MCU8358128.1 winged helix-turn-helix domain-containing protein [Vibrio vulnificus]HAS8504202.1 transcriptional regulator [Vibrio vulnificus]
MSNIGTKFVIAQRFVFDPNSNTLLDQAVNNEVTRLGSNESRILLLLSEKPNEVLTRNELHEFVWREQGFEVDDSSLTQAISTLRKMLKDSTKSPEFVKTVPKRGYQLICSVERINPLLSDSTNNVNDAASEALDQEELENEISTDAVQTSSSEIGRDVAHNAGTSTKMAASQKNWLIKGLFLLAALLPLCVVLLTNPSESKFRLLEDVNGVEVLTPLNHPPLQAWMPSIRQCVNKYAETHTDDSAPVKVIATGGQGNQLILNYIHTLPHSNENVTLRIFSEQNDLGSICK